MKLKILFIVAFALQVITLLGVLSFFLVGSWGYDGSGGVVDNMHFRQFVYKILSFLSSGFIIFFAAPTSIISFFATIGYVIYKKCKKVKFNFSKWIWIIVFFILTLINSFVYSIGFLVLAFYDSFA